MGTVTNPIWVIKKHLQLSASDKLTTAMVAATTTMAAAGLRTPLVGGGIISSTMKQIAHEEGICTVYKGLSTSYLSITEGTIKWVLYGRLKHLTARAKGLGVPCRNGLACWALLGQPRRTKTLPVTILQVHLHVTWDSFTSYAAHVSFSLSSHPLQ